MSAGVMERNGQGLTVSGDDYGLGPRQSAAMEAWMRGATPAPEAPEAPRVRWWRRVNWSRVRGDGGMLAALALVNGFAVHGQALWALDRFAAGIVTAVLFACALESVSLYLQAAAHRARIAGDAALLRLAASYGVGCLVGWLNWSHWADSNPARGAAYAGFSILSPMLWAIRSKDNRRDALRDAGLIDPRSVRFAPIRWVMYPVRTFRSLRAAVGEGVQDPREAWALTAPAAGPAAAPVSVDVPVTVEVQESGPAPAVAPPIAVPGPGVPPPSKAPARLTTRKPRPSGALRPATDADVERIVREVLAEKPAAGRVTVSRALGAAGFRPGDKARLDRIIGTVREGQS